MFHKLENAKAVTSTTLVGVMKVDYPVSSGNCFGVETEEGNHYSIVNFAYENWEEMLKRGITLPVQIAVLEEGGRTAIIHDSRIPPKWYDKRWCEVCCPRDLLPAPQRLAHLRDIDSGHRTEKEGIFSMTMGPRELKRT